MANANSCFRARELPNSAYLQGKSSTAEFEFVNNLNAVAEVTIPAGVLSNRRFKVSLGGHCVGATATNLTVILYAGTALATSVFSTSTKAINASGSSAWFVNVEGVIDATGKILTGVGSGAVNGTAVAAAIATASANADPTLPVIFSASGTLSASNAGNAAYLDWFEVEIL